MRSIRTNISPLEKKYFEKFFVDNNINGVLVGDYTMYLNGVMPAYRLCYAFSEKDKDVAEFMTYMQLKFGDIEKAYRSYMMGRKYDY